MNSKSELVVYNGLKVEGALANEFVTGICKFK